MMGEKGEVWVAGPDVEDANLKVVDVFTVVADVDVEESVYDRIVEFFMELPPMCLIFCLLIALVGISITTLSFCWIINSIWNQTLEINSHMLYKGQTSAPPVFTS